MLKYVPGVPQEHPRSAPEAPQERLRSASGAPQERSRSALEAPQERIRSAPGAPQKRHKSSWGALWTRNPVWKIDSQDRTIRDKSQVIARNQRDLEKAVEEKRR